LQKILILVPAATARGGITNYYQVLKEYLPSSTEYFERGARTWPIRNGFFSELIRAWRDYKVFKERLNEEDVDLVQTTTSLGIRTTIRDGLFIRYAKRKKIKAIVFFRGWDDTVENIIQNKYLSLFKYFFFPSDAVITLSNRSKEKLISWGYKKEIYLETTLVDKKLLSGFTEKLIITKNSQLFETKKVKLLFISRIEKRKGIYELLDAFQEIQQNRLNNFQFNLDIGGDGFELENIKKMIRDEDIENVSVHGFVSGDKKKELFKEANIFIFPSYGEGMPNAVLEAMGFGLPVITTEVGGLKDFFVEKQNGYFVRIANKSDLIKTLGSLISDQERFIRISKNNYKMAESNFRSDVVAERLNIIFEQILNKEK